MDKKQKKMFFSIWMVLALLVLLIGFTLAKYYSSYQAKAALEVAKWSFNVDGLTNAETGKIALSDIMSEVTLEEGKIAPGFDGRVEIDLDASGSEVDVDYSIEATEEGHKPSNMLFQAIVDGNTTEMYATLEELAREELHGTILKSDSTQVKNVTICCIWPYETISDDKTISEEDAEDTAVGTGTVAGKENQYDYTFSLKVVGTQKLKPTI